MATEDRVFVNDLEDLLHLRPESRSLEILSWGWQVEALVSEFPCIQYVQPNDAYSLGIENCATGSILAGMINVSCP